MSRSSAKLRRKPSVAELARSEAHARLLDRIEYHLSRDRDCIPCMGHERDAWISDHPQLQAFAAVQCRRCPVMTLCAEYAREHESHRSGVWGGVTSKTTEIQASFDLGGM